MRRSPSTCRAGSTRSGSAIGRARFDGYRDALLAHGQTLDPALVWDISEGYRADAGYRAASEALANGLRFRAVLAASDELALGCMAAAADRGLAMPGDIAFVGFGGLGWGVFSRPSMTTLSLDVDAVPPPVRDILQTRPDGPAPSPRPVIPTNLVPRQPA